MAHSLPTVKRPLGVHAGLAWWLLVLQLALTPLIFCVHTVEAFEENKVAFLKLVAWTLTGIGVSAVIMGKPGFRGVGVMICDLIGRNLVGLGVVLFLISATASTWFSASPLTSWRGAVESDGGLQTILGYVVLFVATRALCRTVESGWRLLTAAVFATTVVCALALLQLAGRDPMAWEGVSQFAGHVRPFATLAHANSLGAYLVVTIPLVAAFAHRAFQERRWLAAAPAFILAIIAALVVFVTLSRAAWAGFGVAVVLLAVGWAFSSARRSAATVGATTMLFLTLAVGGSVVGWFGLTFGTGVRERLAHVADGSGRSEIWRAAWEMFREKPVIGNGLDTFRLGFGRHRTAAFGQVEGDVTPTKAHNEALHVLATQGGLGGVAILLLLGGLGVCGYRAWQRAAITERPLVTAVLAGLTGFLVTELAGFTGVGSGSLVVCCCALLSRWQEGCGATVSVVAGRWLTRRWTVLAAVLVFLLFVANMGAGHWLLCLGLAGCGLLVAVPLCTSDAAPIPTNRSRGWPAVGASGWVLQLGLGAAIVTGILVNVWCPFEASRACACGDRLLDDDPLAARSHYEKAIAWDATCPTYHVKLSAAAQLCARQAATPTVEQGQQKLAREQLEQAIALVPADAYHHANLAKLLDAAAAADPARRDLGRVEWDRALEMDPKNIGFVAEAARGALARGARGRARLLAQSGLEWYPNDALYIAELAACDLAEGHLIEAARRYQASLHANWRGDAEDEARAYAALASCHLGLGHPACARDLADYARTLQPRWPTATLLLGQALERLGDREGATRCYYQVLSLLPRHPGAAAALRRLANQTGATAPAE